MYFKALDDAAFLAVNSIDEMAIHTSAFTIYFIVPATSGTLEGTGRVVSRAGRTYFAEAKARCGDPLVAGGSRTTCVAQGAADVT